MEPWLLEEQRQRLLDRKAARWPACAACGRSIGSFESCLALEGRIYCPRCVRLHTVSTENLEVVL